MLFNSYNFLFLFLPATLAGLFLLTRLGLLRLAICWLGLASLVFYGVDHPEFLAVIIGSILCNYALGTRFLARHSAMVKLLLLAIGVAGNLLLLGYFKYTGFLTQIADSWFAVGIEIPHIVLPIGISFYTFTQIAYLVDQYRAPHRYRFADYLLFVSFFPHLVAGPILIHKHVIPQFDSPRMGKPSARRLVQAVVFFCFGMAKKVLIADSLSPYVSELFSTSASLGGIEAWAGALLYTLQLYFDFSGYSEMAFGLALMLGVRIPLNFNAPYRATSMIDFWRRWHMSLSRFLREYLYIPLGGNRKGEPRRYLNIFITMMLGGIWHGAGWGFVIWGLIHALAIMINHAWQRTRIFMPVQLGRVLTLLVVVYAWVFFRAGSLQEAGNMLRAMYGVHGWSASGPFAAAGELHSACAWLVFGWIIVFFAPTTRAFALMRPRWWLAVFAAILMTISVLHFGRVSEFLYFQF